MRSRPELEDSPRANVSNAFHFDASLYARWLQVMIGQRLMPRGNHPLAELPPMETVEGVLRDTEEVIRRCVAGMPMHADFVARHCAAG